MILSKILCHQIKFSVTVVNDKKPNLDLNMLNDKFANKLNLPWDCDSGSEHSSLSLSLWLLLSFERDSLSPSSFFPPTDCGKGSQQSSPP